MLINSIEDIKNNYKKLTKNVLLQESIYFNYLPGIRLAKILGENLFLNDNYYLRVAAYLDHNDICKYLIKNNLEINYRVLNQALENKNDDIEIVKLIINNIENVNIKLHTFNRILDIKNYNVLYFLFENGYCHQYIETIKDIKMKEKLKLLIKKSKIKKICQQPNY